MVDDRHRAEDLTQSAFVRLYSAREGWEPQSKFSTYLWRIALNLCHDELRKLKRLGECSLDALDPDADAQMRGLASQDRPPDAQIEQRELAQAIREALLRLAPHYREVVVLRHYEQLKFEEIGVVLGIPAGTVKSRMSEALKQLNRFLKHLETKEETKPWNIKNQPKELLAL